MGRWAEKIAWSNIVCNSLKKTLQGINFSSQDTRESSFISVPIIQQWLKEVGGCLRVSALFTFFNHGYTLYNCYFQIKQQEGVCFIAPYTIKVLQMNLNSIKSKKTLIWYVCFHSPECAADVVTSAAQHICRWWQSEFGLKRAASRQCRVH